MNSPSQIQSIEVSLESLIKSWTRRIKWKTFFESLGGNNDLDDQLGSSWRARLSIFLDSTPVRVFTILLLLIDIIITSLELSSSVLSSCPKNTDSLSSEEFWFHWVGISILCLLCLRSLSLFVGLGRSILRKPGHVLDAVVMAVALVLELFSDTRGGALVLVVSLWRIVRVVDSAFEVSDEAIEAQIKLIICQFQNLRDENARLLEIIVQKDLIIEELREQLHISTSTSLVADAL